MAGGDNQEWRIIELDSPCDNQPLLALCWIFCLSKYSWTNPTYFSKNDLLPIRLLVRTSPLIDQSALQEFPFFSSLVPLSDFELLMTCRGRQSHDRDLRLAMEPAPSSVPTFISARLSRGENHLIRFTQILKCCSLSVHITRCCLSKTVPPSFGKGLK